MKKKKMKYRRRRFILLVLAMLLIGGISFVIGNLFGTKKTEDPPTHPSIPIVENDTAGQSQPEDIAEESVSPEPEPKPQPEKTEEWQLLLVNRSNPLPEDFEVELENVTSQFKVDKRIADPLKKMIAKAKEDGINLVIQSSYRTVAYQQELFDKSVNKYLAEGKTEEEALASTMQWYAVPGTSEHHTGLAIDILSSNYWELNYGFSKTSAFAWLDENAHLFGFVLRYPEDKVEITKISYEPWHYRYVGEQAAMEIKEAQVCLEEYLYMQDISETYATSTGTTQLEETTPSE